jgi:hypothetical protein
MLPNVAYGQIGYGGIGWNKGGGGSVPIFYNGTDTAAWLNYFGGQSRLKDGKYLGELPTAIFNNIGINDANGATG